MSTSQQTDPLIGRLVDGRYRVRARIARGGMATVYVATDLRLERRVALKVMHSHLSDDTVFQGRFIQEARAAARLADPHVVNVFDQGQDGEMAYLVMEYLPGITMRELLREQRRLTIPQTITIMDAVLSGLAAAHRAGIVHRDVKPENVLLAEDGRIKIGDFGLARATSANTATGQMLLGTIAYLAPELVTRGTADARSDIYALGIMLYEMLVGEQPYKGEQPMQIAYQHATDSVPRPSAKNPGVPEQFDELVMWATEREPDDRPVDARAMLDRLREIEKDLGVYPQVVRTSPAVLADADGLDSGELTKVMPGTFTAPTVTTDEDNATRLRRRTRRNAAKGVWILLLVLVLAGTAGGVGWWFGSGPGSLVAVPDVSGGTFEDAQAELAEYGLLAVEGSDTSLDVDEGLVIRSEPAPGCACREGGGGHGRGLGRPRVADRAEAVRDDARSGHGCPRRPPDDRDGLAPALHVGGRGHRDRRDAHAARRRRRRRLQGRLHGPRGVRRRPVRLTRTRAGRRGRQPRHGEGEAHVRRAHTGGVRSVQRHGRRGPRHQHGRPRRRRELPPRRQDRPRGVAGPAAVRDPRTSSA